MPVYKSTIEYAQKDKHDEKAMIEAEHNAFAQAIHYLRGKEFKKVKIDTIVVRFPEFFDLSTARCTIELVEA